MCGIRHVLNVKRHALCVARVMLDTVFNLNLADEMARNVVACGSTNSSCVFNMGSLVPLCHYADATVDQLLHSHSRARNNAGYVIVWVGGAVIFYEDVVDGHSCTSFH